MNLKYLNYCLKINEVCSINRAAEELYLSQPYLSTCIKSLEKELGFTIFLRTRTGIVPTRKGEEFLRIAENIVEEVGRIKGLADDTPEEPLNIATIVLSFVTKSFFAFRKKTAVKCKDTMTEYFDYKRFFESIAGGKHNLGLFLYMKGYMGEKGESEEELWKRYRLKYQELLSETPYCVVTGKGHPFAQKNHVTAEDLLAYPMVYYLLPNDSFSHYLNWLDLPVMPENSCEVTERGQYFDALRSGEYYGIMSQWVSSYESDFHLIPLEHVHIFASFGVVYRKDYRLNMRERQFLDYLKQCLTKGEGQRAS